MEATREIAVRTRVLRRRLGRWAARPERFPGMEIGFALLATILGLVSYALLTGQRAPAEGFSPQLVTLLLVANLLPLLALLLLIARRIALLMARRRARVAGAQLHVRLIGLFATLAAAPTLLSVIFASMLFQFGVQFWFSDRARTVLDNADRVAQAYVDEARSRILDDIVAMGRDISSYSQSFGFQSQSFRDGLAFQVAARNLSDAAVFTSGQGGVRVVASVGMEGPPLGMRLGGIRLDGIPRGQAVALTSARDRIEAVVRLQAEAPYYVYVSRRAEPRVLEQVARTQAAISDYKVLTDRSRALQWRFNLILVVVSLLIVAAAIWFAILLASRIVAPIGELVEAAGRVGTGDLAAEVRLQGAGDEIGALGRAFNRMTSELRSQQAALLAANAQSEGRRLFIEAVLSGVSAGVMSVDAGGLIGLANARAVALLDPADEQLVGRPLAAAVPEFAPLFETARQDGMAAGQISRLRRSDGRMQTLAVRVAADAGEDRTFILTFDDITQQIADQRRAAWSDVARRVAHEIKNPLTPIILSAERLKRRFGKQIGDGRATFDELTDTIVRQVGDLRRMVDEFSAFARMPSATFREENLVEIARQAMFLAEVGAPGIQFTIAAAEDVPPLVCDRRQMGQAFTNIIKNAIESIGEKSEKSEDEHVDIALFVEDGTVVVTVTDSGVGLPSQQRDRLFEPYVTTRQRGTGLGLAIVKRIVEDHQGQLDIADRPGRTGAVVAMRFAIDANRRLLRPGSMSGQDMPDSEQVS
jgi:two-component system nitrogen regulation sensor histidine kinase NtrY